MKIISGNASGDLSLELKYCERCGGLWLLTTGGSHVYCSACTREVEEVPSAVREPETLRERRRQRKSVKRAETAWTNKENERNKNATGGAA